MSEWHEIQSNSIGLDWRNNKVVIFVKQYAFGNIYATITFDQLDELYKKAFNTPAQEKETPIGKGEDHF